MARIMNLTDTMLRLEGRWLMHAIIEMAAAPFQFLFRLLIYRKSDLAHACSFLALALTT